MGSQNLLGVRTCNYSLSELAIKFGGARVVGFASRTLQQYKVGAPSFAAFLHPPFACELTDQSLTGQVYEISTGGKAAARAVFKPRLHRGCIFSLCQERAGLPFVFVEQFASS
jgi:hypothetical protein